MTIRSVEVLKRGQPGEKGDPGPPGLSGVPTEVEVAEDIAYARTFSDGKRSFLEFRLTGDPTDWSAELIAEALTRIGFTGGGGGAVASVNGQTGAVVLDAADVGALPATTDVPVSPIAALSSDWQPYATHPRAVKPLSAPILTFADQAAATIYWPAFVPRTPQGTRGVTLLYSTDHDAGAGGIYGATADSPLDTFAAAGLLFADASGSAQTETPAAIWDEAAGLYRLYYHNNGVLTGGGQATKMATSPDLATYTVVGVVLDDDATGTATHTGYFHPFRVDGGWYGYSLWQSGNVYAYWESDDGVTWTKTGTPVMDASKIDHLTGYVSGWITKWVQGTVIRWHGELWWIGMVGDAATGPTIVHNRICAGKLTADRLDFTGDLIDITPASQAWEQGGISNIGDGVVQDGRLFIPYRAGDDASTNAAFGVLEIL